MIPHIAQQKLNAIHNNGVALSSYAQGIDYLKTSGVLEFLRDLYKPVIASTHEQQVLQSSYSAGALDLLEKLLFFKELFLLDKVPEVPKMSFGAEERALDKGYLTEEEINARRNNTSPDYTKYTKRSGTSTERT